MPIRLYRRLCRMLVCFLEWLAAINAVAVLDVVFPIVFSDRRERTGTDDG